MLKLDKIVKQDRLVRSTTGLNRKAFEELSLSFSEAYRQSLVKPDEKRERGLGGGRKSVLKTIGNKLFFILLYCKSYPTFDIMGMLFGFDRSCAHDWVHRLMPVLETALGKKQALPERKIHSIAEFLEKFPEVKEVILDGTERPVQRPKDNERQKEHYSGKKNGIPANIRQEAPAKSGSFC